MPKINKHKKKLRKELNVEMKTKELQKTNKCSNSRYLGAIVLVIIVIAIIGFGLAFTGNHVVEPGETEEFAKCLTSKGATMYGTEWCSHCQNQKKMFGDAFSFINFVDCDANPTACKAAGVSGYPTWVINGQLYPGEKALSVLASLSGCSL